MKAEFPVKKAIYVTTGIIGFSLLGYLFLTTFARAESDVQGISSSLSLSQCQTMCSELISQGMGYGSCTEFMQKEAVMRYVNECLNKTGPCQVSVMGILCLVQ